MARGFGRIDQQEARLVGPLAVGVASHRWNEALTHRLSLGAPRNTRPVASPTGHVWRSWRSRSEDPSIGWRSAEVLSYTIGRGSIPP